MKKTIAAILAGALCLTALTACGGSKTDSAAADSSSAAAGDDKTITVGATPTPHAEILNAAKDALKAEGYTLNVVEFTDYVQPNTALVDGDLDANYFQRNLSFSRRFLVIYSLFVLFLCFSNEKILFR